MFEFGLDDLEGALEILLYCHNGPIILVLPEVVRDTEKSHQLLLEHEFIPVLDHLVGPHHQVIVVILKEVEDHISSITIGNAPLVVLPACHVALGVRPQQVQRDAVVGDREGPLNPRNLIERFHFGTETPMDAEYLVLDDSTEGHHVEDIVEHLPELNPYSVLALVIEAIQSIHTGNLVVSPQHEDVLGESDLVAEQQHDHLQ